MNWCTVKNRINKTKDPEFSAPSAIPLSPCVIEPFITVNGKKVENKGYIPVSLLKKAIDNDRMLNIAVAGNYGVGKSSIINTAEEELNRGCLPKHRFIRITLASLLTQSNKPGNEQEERVLDSTSLEKIGSESKTKQGKLEEREGEKHGQDSLSSPSELSRVTDRQIEYSILQQILYHDRPQKTPKSRIKRIHKTQLLKPYLIASVCIIVFLSLLLLLKPLWLSSFIDLEHISDHLLTTLTWGPVIALILIFILVCRYVSRHFSLSVARIGYKDIEMKVKEEMSIFNTFMDEIVYFFESTKYDVVVFEDLDRFENRDVIFYKLRELNTILNNSLSIKRRINFVYAVLDDLFDSTERVKFFDYIITVIPVINSLNSYEKLKDYIQPQELFERLGQTELTNLCDYLQDMRLLLNIVNEFNQFVPLIDSNVLSVKVLFGLIVYKNYVPSDFSLMYNKSGVAAEAIERADENRMHIIKDYDNEIERHRKAMDSARDEYEKQVIALRKLYLDKGKELSDYPTYNLSIRIDKDRYLFDRVAEDASLFKKVREGQARFFINNGAVTNIPSFSSIELNVGGSGFDETVNKYKTAYENQVAELEKEISSLSLKRRLIPETIQGIYQTNPGLLDVILRPIEDAEKRGLLKFLFLNGYIDKHYQYYISYFYPNALSHEDRVFVMRAGRHEGVQYETHLDRIEEVLKRFSPRDFENNTSLLNVDLVREVFQNPKYENYRSPICELIASSKSLDFLLASYKALSPIKNPFYFQLLRTYDYWNEINEYDDDQQEVLREIYVRFCELRDSRLNPAFKDWLPNNYAFLDKRWDVITPKRLLENVFKSCNPVFDVLKLKNTPDVVLQDLIDNQRYEFSRQNFNAIVKKLGFYERYSAAAYTALREANVPALIKTIHNNWSRAIKTVFPDTSTREDSSALTDILNYPNIPLYEARLYISKQRTHIRFADRINDDVLTFAFDNSLVEATWTNIYYYVIAKEKSLPLAFLYNNRIRSRISESLSPKEESHLCRLLVFSNAIKLSHYRELVALFSTPFKEVVNAIQPARMKILIENDFLEFNEENYKTIKNHYPSLSSLFLSKNVKAFFQSSAKIDIDCSDAVASLKAIETKKGKCDFIRAIADSEFAPNAELISLVSPLVTNGDIKVSELSIPLLIGIISNSTDEMRIGLGRRAITSIPFKKETVSGVLQAMGGDFRRLNSDSMTSSISYSRDAMQVINCLVINGFVKSYERKGDKIIVSKRS